MLGTMIDWTQVLIVGVPAYIAAVGGAAAAVLVALNRRSLRTPSGDRIGHVVERTHDLAAVNAAAVARVEKTVNGGPYPAEKAAEG